MVLQLLSQAVPPLLAVPPGRHGSDSSLRAVMQIDEQRYVERKLRV